MAILGQSTGTPGAYTVGNLDRVYVQPYTVAGGDFTITSLHTLIDGSGSFRLVVYASDGASGGPGTLLCYTANLTCVGPFDGTTQTDVSGTPNTATTLTNGVVYWIGFHFGDNNNLLYRSTSAPDITLDTRTGATFASGAPNPYGTVASSAAADPHTFWLVGTQASAAAFVPKVTIL